MYITDTYSGIVRHAWPPTNIYARDTRMADGLPAGTARANYTHIKRSSGVKTV